MTRKDDKKALPFSIRLSEAEKASLRAQAGRVPLGAFIRSRILDTPIRTSQRAPVKNTESLSQLLAKLGQSHLANNLNQLAKAANFGSLPVTEETEAELRQACKEVVAMRILLMQALGMKVGNGIPGSLSDRFARSSEKASR
jgi:hypothetical protein